MFINDEAQKQVLPIIAKTTANPATDLQERAGSLLQLNPGQQVKAEIIANLPNSLYLARIAGEMYQLEIPLNIQPGETMEMTFVAAEPRITFNIHRQPEGSASVQLSSTGRLLANALEAPPLATSPEVLLDDPAQGSVVLATRLSEALAHSGLFYESHLAQWAAGGLQLSEILKEPQGKLSRTALGEEPKAVADDLPGDGLADPRTLPLVKEQLHLLNTGVLVWKGEAWAGQGIEVSVTERGAEEGRSALEASITLKLPCLGEVEARLLLAPEGVTIDLVCERPGGASVLKEGGAELRHALNSAGLHLKRLAAKDVEES